MTLSIDIPDLPDHQGPAPPPYTPYATESESTVVSNLHHNGTARRATVRNGHADGAAHASASSAPRPSPRQRLTLHTVPDSPTTDNAQAGPSRRPRHSSISKPRAPFPSEHQPEASSPAAPAPHTPPRPEDLRDRGRSNIAWRQYLHGLNVPSEPDIGNLSLDDKSNKPLPPTPPSLPPRSPRPPPPVPPPSSRLDPRSRQPPPPPIQSTPPRPAAAPVSAPITRAAQHSPIHQHNGPPSRPPQDYAVHHTWHNHPQPQPRPQRHSAPVTQHPPVQYVYEVPVQRVYEVPQPVQRVHEVPVQRPLQSVQPPSSRQVHHAHSMPQFAHPDSQHLVRPHAESERGRPNGSAGSGPASAGPSSAAFHQLGLPTIPDRRSSLPPVAGPPTPPKTSSPASQFPPPILRTAPRPPEPGSFPPPPRHIVARGGAPRTPQRSPQRSETTPKPPRRAPSIIDLTQDTSPSSAGSPPLAARAPRAQSDVGRPSPRSAPSASQSVVSAPSASSTPRRKASTAVATATTSPSPGSPASPAKVRCAGFTRAGERCKRLVKGGAPGATLLGDGADARYCKDHAGLLLKPAGFYWRAAPGGSGTWVEFKLFIPRALGEQTQALLRTTMEAGLTPSETPGFLYVYELRGMGAQSTSFFKVGRSENVPRRIGQWTSQCASHAPVLRDVFPLAAEGGSNLPGAMRSAGEMAAASKRWERLVHLELADRAAAERPLAFRALEGRCADCGAVHREIFPLAASEGYAVVVEAITRWEKFVRTISA